MKIDAKLILIIGLLIAVVYLGKDKLLGFFGFGTDGGGGSGGGGGGITDVIGDTTGFIGGGLVNQGSGLTFEGTQLEGDPLANFTETFWNFATGVWKANPVTMGTGQFYDMFTGWLNDYMKDNNPDGGTDSGGDTGNNGNGGGQSGEQGTEAQRTTVNRTYQVTRMPINEQTTETTQTYQDRRQRQIELYGQYIPVSIGGR